GLLKESYRQTLEDNQQFSQPDKFTFSTGEAGIRQGPVWELGTEVSRITYKEPDIMEEKGLMYGIVGSYTYRGKVELLLPEGGMLKLEGRGAWGKVDYDGGLSDGTPYTINNIDDYMWEFRGLAGADFSIFKAVTLTPYTGMGYRYLNDDSSIDPAGYRRESNYIYSPVGVEITTPLKNGWLVGATLEYDYFWKGTQKSHLGDFLAGLDTLENAQDKGYGLRGSIKVQKRVEKIDLVIEPYIRYWNIDKSNVKSITYSGTPIGLVGWEPKNNSTEFGIRFAAKL
ncbi:MAG: autotransporter domain-containing protein, partial [Candidatus Omnitrophota bacterium]|nr:autotransporter domain-containing protein [Candidatus Omnitrophota bacterium]